MNGTASMTPHTSAGAKQAVVETWAATGRDPGKGTWTAPEVRGKRQEVRHPPRIWRVGSLVVQAEPCDGVKSKGALSREG